MTENERLTKLYYECGYHEEDNGAEYCEICGRNKVYSLTDTVCEECNKKIDAFMADMAKEFAMRFDVDEVRAKELIEDYEFD